MSVYLSKIKNNPRTYRIFGKNQYIYLGWFIPGSQSAQDMKQTWLTNSVDKDGEIECTSKHNMTAF